jgi:hypothetical protein
MTGGLANVTTVSSKVRSPWNPTKFRAVSIVVVFTGSGITVPMGTDVSKEAMGNETVMDGVGVGCAGVAEATPLTSSEAAAASIKPARGFNLKHPDDWDLFFTNVERVEVNR